MQNQAIDFVVLWVDGKDPEWKKQRDFYAEQINDDDSFRNGNERFRDWEQLNYWFRGVEQFAPWVNRIHFVTCGHLPGWLDTKHPKLHIVRHDEIIPKEYLPTFSSRAIELCIKNIEGLSERFVFFNDDMFLVSPIPETVFFKDGLPCCEVGLGSFPTNWQHFWSCMLLQDMQLINRNFISREVVRRHWRKFFCPVYGYRKNKNTVLQLPWRRESFSFFWTPHAPVPYLKSVHEEVWEREKDSLLKTCSHRFRSFDDVNQYVFLWWQICEGKFTPARAETLSAYVSVLDDPEIICNTILKHERPILCINDTRLNENEFIERKRRINQAFDALFPEKCSFEK